MIKLIVLDVDGTMTNGAIGYDSNETEYKTFNVKDGFAIVNWQRVGRIVAIITGRNSPIVAKRAKELKIKYLYQGCKKKLETLKEILQKENLSFKNVAAIGDDLNDYMMLKSAKISFVPSDASDYVKEIADVILTKNGGEGAVAQMIEMLIKQENLEKEYVEFWQK